MNKTRLRTHQLNEKAAVPVPWFAYRLAYMLQLLVHFLLYLVGTVIYSMRMCLQEARLMEVR